MNTPQESSSRKLAEVLDKELPEPRIAEVLSECFNATTLTKSGVVIPDWRTRLAAVQLALAYKVGKPIERQQVMNVNVGQENESSLDERLRDSPALRAMIRKMLEKAESQIIDA
jgi:hypothetical protein